ncbi:MAG: tetratricopeptide repeat protein [Burkholderiales bacterium]|nr:tetratricopeptide repeat protein [Burkholderiales bacterium]
MAYNLEEQEQIAAIQSWWKQYGNLVVIAATAALLTIAAFQGWRTYRGTQTAAALALYEQLDGARRDGEQKKVIDIAREIGNRYGATPYAVLAAFAGASAAFASGDLAAAGERLRWVIDNAREEETRDLARLRLAGVLLDEKKHAEALALMERKPVESMTGLYAEMRGDILTADGRPADARGAYQLALDRSEPGSTYRATIQLKLDALGEPAPVAVK